MSIAQQYPHYFKDVGNLNAIDVYRVIDLWGVSNPCLQHALKKILVAGNRGVKDQIDDIEEAIISLQRYLEMVEEDALHK
jgi:oligoribonuclease (3'-5' exoribonuclease)